jgi:cellulose biosynthesis protein BcsQ
MGVFTSNYKCASVNPIQKISCFKIQQPASIVEESNFMSKLITFYNNKGGVSKTTTLFNLAVHLAKSGKKVLIADCDPQCNATELFLASSTEFDNPDKSLPGTSIYEALRPRFEGEVARVDVNKVELVPSPIYKGLFLLRGDLEFASAEGYLAIATNQAITENVHEKNTYLAIHRLLYGLGSENKFDYVLCDVGPSTGAISRMVVLACDGFFIPLTLDRFCSQAVRVLGKVLTEWIKRHEEISKTFEPFKLKPFPGKPCFLGAIIQNFKVHSGTSPKASYQRWQQKINDGLKSSVLDNAKIPLRAGLNLRNPFIASIRDVGPLVPIAQMFGRAIFDIDRRHTEAASTTGNAYGGAVWQNWVDRMNAYKDEILKIADALPE